MSAEAKGFHPIVWSVIAIALLLASYVVAFSVDKSSGVGNATSSALAKGVFGPLVFALLYLIPKANRSWRHYLKAVSAFAAALLFSSFGSLDKVPSSSVGHFGPPATQQIRVAGPHDLTTNSSGPRGI